MWMNQPSTHQEDLSAELIARGADLGVVYASALRKTRREIGWQVKTDAPWITFLRSRLSFWQAVRITWRQRRLIHVVNGIWAEPVFLVVIGFCCLLGIPCCIYSEAPASAFASTWESSVQEVAARSDRLADCVASCRLIGNLIAV